MRRKKKKSNVSQQWPLVDRLKMVVSERNSSLRLQTSRKTFTKLKLPNTIKTRDQIRRRLKKTHLTLAYLQGRVITKAGEQGHRKITFEIMLRPHLRHTESKQALESIISDCWDLAKRTTYQATNQPALTECLFHVLHTSGTAVGWYNIYKHMTGLLISRNLTYNSLYENISKSFGTLNI